MIQCTESFLIENEYHFDERNHSEIADVVRCCLLIDWLMVFGCGCENVVCAYPQPNPAHFDILIQILNDIDLKLIAH